MYNFVKSGAVGGRSHTQVVVVGRKGEQGKKKRNIGEQKCVSCKNKTY